MNEQKKRKSLRSVTLEKQRYSFPIDLHPQAQNTQALKFTS